MKRLFCLLLVIAGVVFAACDDFEEPCKDCTDLLPVVKDLTQREDVLFNLEAVYNHRRIDWYDSALAPNFVFYLSPGDAASNMPELWNRATEMALTSKLFDTSKQVPMQRIYMDIRTEDGVAWTSFNPASAPAETWYSTTLYYDFRFDFEPKVYIPVTGARAEFIVRDAGPTGNHPHHWQLVEMRDLGAFSPGAASASATEPVTWGQVKALFVEDGCLSCLCNPAMCPDDHRLSLKAYVLRNIEDAYNQRRLDWYDATLDQNHTFFLSAEDAMYGLPASWDRATEVLVHSRLFDENYEALPADSIYLNIDTPANFPWVEIQPASAPNETWYQATLYYTFTIRIEPSVYRPLTGSRAVFTVRDAGPLDGYAHHWQLVELRDLGGAGLAADATMSEASSWGQVKALYR